MEKEVDSLVKPEYYIPDAQLIANSASKLGVTHFITDLDNTIFMTESLYLERMKKYSRRLADASNFDAEAVFKFFNSEVYKQMQIWNVHPKLMSEAAKLTANNFGLSRNNEDFKAARRELLEIFVTSPRVCIGTEENIKVLKKAGLKIVGFTHAGKVWTKTKLETNGLDTYFERVECVSTLSKKDHTSLLALIKDLDISPEVIIFAGDSWRSDIETAIKAGIPLDQILRVRTEYEDANVGKIDGIMQIRGSMDFASAIVEMGRN